MVHWERSPPTKEARVLYIGPSARLRLRESKSQSRMRTEMGKMRENIPEGEFVFEQSGAPFPARGLIILVTKRPKLSAILNCASHDPNGFGPPF